MVDLVTVVLDIEGGLKGCARQLLVWEVSCGCCEVAEVGGGAGVDGGGAGGDVC